MDVSARWTILGAGTLLALSAIAVLPPRPCDSDDHSLAKDAICGYHGRGGSSHVAVAERTRNRLEQAARRRQLADSLLELRNARQVTGGVISVYYESSLSTDSARLWLGQAQRELAMLPGTGTGERVVVLLQSDPAGAARRGNPDDGSRRWWYYPRLDRFATTAHGGACVVVLDLTVRPAIQPLQQQRPNLLDWCALYARFGSPGRAVERWASSAFSFGWRDNSSIAEMVQAAPSGLVRSQTDYRVHACQRSGGAACLQYTDGAGETRPVWLLRRQVARGLLAWLLTTGEPDQFARFWRDGGSLESALTSGYGQPAGDLLQTWARQRYEPVAARPLASSKVLLAGAVWFSVAMAAAFVAMQRRQVG